MQNHKQKQNFKIRKMKIKDMDIAIDLARQEGWNPGIYDSVPFFRTDENGFFIAELNGEPIATISAVAYDKNFGFIGFFIVKKKYRGKRVGIELGNYAMKYLGNRNIGIDGVLEKQKNYENIGFKFAYTNARYEYLHTISLYHPECKERSKKKIFRFTQHDELLEKILKYDRQFFPANRNIFLKFWRNRPETKSFVYLEDDKIAGYGVFVNVMMVIK